MMGYMYGKEVCCFEEGIRLMVWIIDVDEYWYELIVCISLLFYGNLNDDNDGLYGNCVDSVDDYN